MKVRVFCGAFDFCDVCIRIIVDEGSPQGKRPEILAKKAFREFLKDYPLAVRKEFGYSDCGIVDVEELLFENELPEVIEELETSGYAIL